MSLPQLDRARSAGRRARELRLQAERLRERATLAYWQAILAMLEAESLQSDE